MPLKPRLISLWSNLFRKGKVENELGREVDAYLDLVIEKKMNQGLSYAEARRQALIEVGGMDQVKENVRGIRIGHFLETFSKDLVFGVRMLAKNPVFTTVAVLTLALGIGANTAIFSVVNSVLLRSLPYHQPDRLVMIWEKRIRENVNHNVVAPADFFDWQKRCQVCEGMAAEISSMSDLTGSGDPERIGTGVVSTSFFQVLGVNPIIGRTFLPEEEQRGRDAVVILNYGIWQRRFGADPNILGKKITLSGAPVEVIGVLPQSFRFYDSDLEFWRPLVTSSPDLQTRVSHFLNVYARLKPGISVERARTEMDLIGNQLSQEYPAENGNHGAMVVDLREELVGSIRRPLFILLAAVALMLLIACANVANLLLARASSRHREIVIRAALGATRGRIIRQFLTESMLLALVGGGLGVILALWGVEMLQSLIPSSIPQLNDMGPDARVLGYTLGISLLTGLLFGLAPALQASGLNLSESLKEGGWGLGAGARRGLRNVLVVAEVAVALVLLIGAGLMIRSFITLQNVNPGFDVKNVYTVRVELSGTRYTEQIARTFFEALVAKTRALPGVETAAMVSHLPLTTNDARRGVTVEGYEPKPDEPVRAHLRVITPDYFHTMKIPLIAGRFFTEQDTDKSPLVVLINQTAARRYVPDGNAVGKRLRMGGTTEWREIIGVVSDVKHWGLDNAVNPEMYYPNQQLTLWSGVLVVRSSADPKELAGAIRGEVHSLDKDLPLGRSGTMEEIVARSQSVQASRFYMSLLGIFAGVALLLASAGIYGVMSHAVAQRTREIGIRIALGASRAAVLKLVVGHALVLALIGIAIGLGSAVGLTRLMSNLLFQVSATDNLTFVAIAILLALVAVIASYIPARRAMKVDPVEALRFE